MLYIFPNSSKKEVDKYYNPNKECFSYEKPKDWEFMKKSGEILDNIPDTWKAYPDTAAGKVQIIEMEFKEFMNAKTPEEMCHELEHLGSACLCLWRTLKDIKM